MFRVFYWFDLECSRQIWVLFSETHGVSSLPFCVSHRLAPPPLRSNWLKPCCGRRAALWQVCLLSAGFNCFLVACVILVVVLLLLELLIDTKLLQCEWKMRGKCGWDFFFLKTGYTLICIKWIINENHCDVNVNLSNPCQNYNDNIYLLVFFKSYNILFYK